MQLTGPETLQQLTWIGLEVYIFNVYCLILYTNCWESTLKYNTVVSGPCSTVYVFDVND